MSGVTCDTGTCMADMEEDIRAKVTKVSVGLEKEARKVGLSEYDATARHAACADDWARRLSGSAKSSSFGGQRGQAVRYAAIDP